MEGMRPRGTPCTELLSRPCRRGDISDRMSDVEERSELDREPGTSFEGSIEGGSRS